jgi:hypothetical protein
MSKYLTLNSCAMLTRCFLTVLSLARITLGDAMFAQRCEGLLKLERVHACVKRSLKNNQRDLSNCHLLHYFLSRTLQHARI